MRIALGAKNKFLIIDGSLPILECEDLNLAIFLFNKNQFNSFHSSNKKQYKEVLH